MHCQQKYREHGSHALAAFNQAMAKRRKATFDACEEGNGELALSPVIEARNRLGIAPERMKGIERVAATTLEAAGCSLAGQAIDALRYSSEEVAIRFLATYDSIPPADLQHLTIDRKSARPTSIPRRLLVLAMNRMIWVSARIATIQAALSLPDVVRGVIRRARTKRGWRACRVFLELRASLFNEL